MRAALDIGDRVGVDHVVERQIPVGGVELSGPRPVESRSHRPVPCRRSAPSPASGGCRPRTGSAGRHGCRSAFSKSAAMLAACGDGISTVIDWPAKASRHRPRAGTGQGEGCRGNSRKREMYACPCSPPSSLVAVRSSWLACGVDRSGESLDPGRVDRPVEMLVRQQVAAPPTGRRRGGRAGGRRVR